MNEFHVDCAPECLAKDEPLIADCDALHRAWKRAFAANSLFEKRRHVVVGSLSQSVGLIEYLARTPESEIQQQAASRDQDRLSHQNPG